MRARLAHGLAGQAPPSWAVGFGEDRQGVFAELPLPQENLSMEMRWVPPGSFSMGSPEGENGRSESEGPQRRVGLSRGFWLARTPCSVAHWMAVMEEAKEVEPDRASHPQAGLTWKDCTAFCRRLGEVLGGVRLRLPTEAEWEYACRAGTDTAFNDGSACTQPTGKDSALDRLGWYRENSSGRTHALGQKACNAWGLCDMHGTVWEWCSDWYGTYDGAAREDPSGPGDGRYRVLRGGCCWFGAGRCRSAYRFANDPSLRPQTFGFRLAAGL